MTFLRLLGPALLAPLLLTACRTPAARTTGGDLPCTDLYAAGKRPQGRAPLTLACHGELEVAVDPATGAARYSAEYLTPSDMNGRLPRRAEFTPDPSLPAALRVESGAYTRSGFDRGHLSPAADFKGTPDGMEASFYTSNVAPQDPELNREAWAGLEGAARGCARRLGGIYILTGTLEEGPVRTLPRTRLPVPSAFWKVVQSGQDYRAFVFPNVPTPRQRSFARFEVTLAALEARTGLTLLPGTPLKREAPGRLCTGSFGRPPH